MLKYVWQWAPHDFLTPSSSFSFQKQQLTILSVSVHSYVYHYSVLYFFKFYHMNTLYQSTVRRKTFSSKYLSTYLWLEQIGCMSFAILLNMIWLCINIAFDKIITYLDLNHLQIFQEHFMHLQGNTEPGIGKEKKKRRKYLGGSRGMLPWKMLKVGTKVCAVCGILEANLKKSSTLKFILNISFLPSICIYRSENLKKSSTLKFIMNISFLPSICIHRSIILIFIEKKYACRFFPTEKILCRDFRFSILRESSHLRQIPDSGHSN